MVISKDGGNFERDVQLILGANGLDKWSWSERFIILIQDPGIYYATEIESDLSEVQAKQTLENNIYKTAILVDLSVVNAIWSNKVITSLPKPIAGIGKRRAHETTIFSDENDSKRHEKDDLNGQILSLNEIFNMFRNEQDSTKKMLLLNKHSDLATQIQEQFDELSTLHDLKTSKLQNEVNMLTKKLQTQQKQQQQLQRMIETEETNHQEEIQNHEKNIKNLEEKIRQLVSSKADEDELDNVKNEKLQLIGQRNMLENHLKDLNKKNQNLTTLNYELNDKLNKVTNELNQACEEEQLTKVQMQEIRNSAKKQRRIISDSIKKSFSPLKMSFNYGSDSEDETDSKLLSPSSLSSKCKVSNLNVSLNPRKAGLTQFNENEMTFGNWWQQNIIQIDLLEAEIGAKNTL